MEFGELGRSGGHAANPVASVGEYEEEAAADDADHEREALHDLVHLLLPAGEEAIGDPVIRQRDRREHHHGQHGVHQVDQPHAEPRLVRHGHAQPVLEQRQPSRRYEAVVHFPVWRPEAVGEVEEEAGGGADAQQRVDHGGLHRAARAVTGRGRQQHLEREKRPRRQKVDQH